MRIAPESPLGFDLHPTQCLPLAVQNYRAILRTELTEKLPNRLSQLEMTLDRIGSIHLKILILDMVSPTGFDGPQTLPWHVDLSGWIRAA
jgi:hypothetical protein